MKKKILLAFALAVVLTVLFAISVSAATPVKTWDISATSADSVTAYLYEDTSNSGYYTLTISGIGNMKYWSSYSDIPWYSNRSKITSAVIEDGITGISNDTFNGCTGLISIQVPFVGTTTSSRFGHIFGTSNSDVPSTLKTVIITGGTLIDYSAFKDCRDLTSIVIPDSVTTIGDNAFYNCFGLTSIVIPDSVTSIGKAAFYNCARLTSITLPFVGATKGGKTNTHFEYIFGASSYDYVNYVPASLKTVIITGGTSIDKYAFEGCSNLTSITIPDSITFIGFAAFSGCTALTGVYITDLAAWCGISFDSDINNPLYYAKKLYLNGELVTDLVIPDGVTSIGDYAFNGCTSLTSVTIPNGTTSIDYAAFWGCTSLTSVVIPDSVTTIAAYAFSGCSNIARVYITDLVAWCGISFGNYSANPIGYPCDLYLNGELVTDLVIPDSVTTIGDNAFYNCTGLKSVKIPDSVTSIGIDAFGGCAGLTRATIGNSVTSIGINAFIGCSSLTSVTIGDSVTSIGDYVFSGCSGLTSVVIPDSVTSIGINAFIGCSSLTSVTIGDSVTTIGSRAFEGCSSLTSIVIPDSVTSIDISAFSGCTGLTSVTIGDGVTTIGGNAFYNCIGLKSVEIPDSVTSIDISAFSGCTGLTSVTIGDGVTSIGDSAFFRCTNLTSVTIGDSVTSIGDYVFSGCYGLTSVVIPDSVTSIGDSVFSSCSGLKSVTIGDSVTSIGDYVFSGCSGLTSVVIPDSVTTIGDSAFGVCTGLTSIVIPDSVTSIGDNAFDGCTGLTSIVIPDSVTSIGHSAFWRCTGLTIYCEAIKQPSGWSTSWNPNDRPVIWDYDNTLKDEIFDFKGYSFSWTGQLSFGFDVDCESVETYETLTGKTLEIGVLVAAYDKLKDAKPLDEMAQPVNNGVQKFSFSRDVFKYNIKIFNLKESLWDVKLAVSAYIYDGKVVKYEQENGISDTVAGISYNEAKAQNS